MIPYFSQKVYNEFAGNEKRKVVITKSYKSQKPISKKIIYRRNELYEDLKNS